MTAAPVAVDQAPAEALLGPGPLREARDVLLRLKRAEGGSARLGALAEQLTAWLQDREEAEELGSFLGQAAAWDEAGVAREDAETALRGAAHFLTLGNNQAAAVEVTSASGQSVAGKLGGIGVEFSLDRSPASSSWGQWSANMVVEGPPALLGKRLVAATRKPDNNVFEDGQLRLKPGDLIFLADAVRAAYLELATFDRMPEISRGLAQLLKQLEEAGSADGGVDAIRAPREMLDAARFLNRLDLLPSEQARVRERLRRLQEAPVGRELLRAARADGEWWELAEALAPKAEQLYTAARSAAPRIPTAEPRQVATLKISLRAVLLGLVLLGLVAFAATQFLQQREEAAVEELPLYSLQTSSAPQTAPLLSGTPLMPKVFG